MNVVNFIFYCVTNTQTVFTNIAYIALTREA